MGRVDAVELVTVGQRRGMGHSTDGKRRFALSVDVRSATVVVGTADEVLVDEVRLAPGSAAWERKKGRHA